VRATTHAVRAVPSLRVTFPATAAQAWKHWLDSSVLGGDSNVTQEKTLLIRLHSFAGSHLATVELHRVAIRGIAPAEPTNDTNGVARVTAELYARQIALSRPD